MVVNGTGNFLPVGKHALQLFRDVVTLTDSMEKVCHILRIVRTNNHAAPKICDQLNEN